MDAGAPGGFGLLDVLLFAAYIVLLVVLSVRKSPGAGNDETGFLLSGRKLTLPAFVATLVSTWYGGILGVGEFSYLYGLANWVVFGLPYYVFAVLFALFLSEKVRASRAVTIPEAIGHVYGPRAAAWSAGMIVLLVNPAPYILMIAVLVQFVMGYESWLITIAVAVFSAAYVSWGGFGAVVRTDKLQMLLMYAGFGILLGAAWMAGGSPAEIWSKLPETHREPTGGQPISYLVVWFFIALWTFVDPSFHQRAAAASSGAVARRGILVSVALWFVFDALVLLCAFYGVVLFPEVGQAVLIFPEMAATLLPAGLRGLFMLTLLATVMSTLDSFLFLSGQTVGRDLTAQFPELQRFGGSVGLVRWGIALSAALGLLLVWLIPSVIGLWYVIGSIVIPGLIFPVLGVYYPGFRAGAIFPASRLMLPPAVSLMWLLLGVWEAGAGNYAWLGIEPFYPGMAVALLMLGVGYLRPSARTTLP
jgi:SSS family solute:Na+ symporter